MKSKSDLKGMTIVEMTIVLVISAIVLSVAIQGVGILRRLSYLQTNKMIVSNALINDYLLLETAISSCDSTEFSKISATFFCKNKTLRISNRDSVAIFGRDTLFKSAHRITFRPEYVKDTLVVTIFSQSAAEDLIFMLTQRIQRNRNEEIQKIETTFNNFHE